MSRTQIQAFKLFLREHPSIVKEIRAGRITLQEIYEQYILLGEEDPTWEQYKNKKQQTTSKDSKQLYQKLWKHVEQLDVNQVEDHIQQLNGAIQHIMTLIDQFKKHQQNNYNDKNSKDSFFHPYD